MSRDYHFIFVTYRTKVVVTLLLNSESCYKSRFTAPTGKVKSR
jgi:hypothetical protein